jgi:NAD(P)H-hydrate epimerase
LPGDAAVNYGILLKSGVPLKVHSEVGDEGTLTAELDGSEWVVDALFGSGLKGPLRPPFDRVVTAINASRPPVFAVDVPSGLDCDTGTPMGPTVRAHHTATVVAPKKGFAEPGAREWLGEVHVVGMGAPRRLLEGLGAS